MKKYIVCKKCGFENLPGTQFCQRCGSKISLKFTDKIASSLAGTGQKGSSLAPLGAMAIEAQAEELGKTAAPPKLVSVIPLENGDCIARTVGNTIQNILSSAKTVAGIMWNPVYKVI